MLLTAAKTVLLTLQLLCLPLFRGAKRGDATTLAHEIGEFGRAYNYDAYKQYVDTVINMLMEMDAIHNKQSDRQFLADLKKIHEVYAQSVYDNHSTNNIPQNAEKAIQKNR